MNILQLVELALIDLTTKNVKPHHLSITLFNIESYVFTSQHRHLLSSKGVKINRKAIINALDKLTKSKKIVRHKKANSFYFTLACKAISKPILREIIEFLNARIDEEYLNISNEKRNILNSKSPEQFFPLRTLQQNLKREHHFFIEKVKLSSDPHEEIQNYIDTFTGLMIFNTPMGMLTRSDTPSYIKPILLKHIA